MMPQSPPINSRPSRKNVTRACEPCRRRRTKCNAVRPSCSRCLDHNTSCNYAEEEDGRKPASKSYVNLLRNRIDLLEQVLQFHCIDINASIAAIKRTRRSDNPPFGAGDRTLHDFSNVDDLCTAFEGIFSLDESLNYEQDGEIRYFGATSGRLEFRSKNAIASNTQLESTMAGIPANALNTGIPRPELSRLMLAADTDHKIPEPLKLHLIDIFFTWQNPWSQLVDENLFRQSRANHGRFHSLLLENCILAYGSRFTDIQDVRSDPADPNSAGRLFYEKAQLLLYYDLKRPSLTTIQALALMNTLHVSFGSDAAGWLCQGIATRIALDMGLNLDAASLEGSELISRPEIELRRQIYWALYCDDKLSAAYTGRICSLLEFQGSVNLPSIPPCPPESSDETFFAKRQSVLLHRALISLCIIMEKILVGLYAPKPQCGDRRSSAFFESCTLQLQSWFYDLPRELRIDRISVAKDALPQSFTLLMVYYTTCILLAKPFSSKVEASTETQHDKTATANGKIKSNRIRVTLEHSAKQICAIARKYRQIFGSFRQSAITATHCLLSAAVVFLDLEKDPMIDPSPRSKDNLEVCLGALDELSTSWNAARRIRENLVHLVETQRGNTNIDPAIRSQTLDHHLKTWPQSELLNSDHDNAQLVSEHGGMEDLAGLLSMDLANPIAARATEENFGLELLAGFTSEEYDNAGLFGFNVE